ncbi:methylphosphotriester-DNA--protein-cysteine methyltransferase family protein [Bacillaceae bacterium Marseille-Q3522]|nr:methylphosphotriester-DNA--protein-cysteine methyltransferase family protein [Bacillaceae bacterium Marseille-Q3522]
MDNDIFQTVYETMKRCDTSCDGLYYVGIKSTGIYCRPSCRSRLPKPENVEIYHSAEEAEKAGYRPCKRCRPDTPGKNGPDATVSKLVINLIQERYSENLTLEKIATGLNMSPYHLQRIFKRITGKTPANQLLLMRIEAAKHDLIQKEKTITEIATAVGYRSVSHFSAVFKKRTGCTPHEFRGKHR